MLIKGVLAFVTILVAECNLINYRNITRIPIISYMYLRGTNSNLDLSLIGMPNILSSIRIEV
jgi:hypothetical protein